MTEPEEDVGAGDGRGVNGAALAPRSDILTEA